MTMTPGELERKVRQLDNDVQAIYAMLAGISAQQSRMGNRLDLMDVRFDGIDAKLELLTGQFETLDGKLDQLIARG